MTVISIDSLIARLIDGAVAGVRLENAELKEQLERLSQEHEALKKQVCTIDEAVTKYNVSEPIQAKKLPKLDVDAVRAEFERGNEDLLRRVTCLEQDTTSLKQGQEEINADARGLRDCLEGLVKENDEVQQRLHCAEQRMAEGEALLKQQAARLQEHVRKMNEESELFQKTAKRLDDSVDRVLGRMSEKADVLCLERHTADVLDMVRRKVDEESSKCTTWVSDVIKASSPLVFGHFETMPATPHLQLYKQWDLTIPQNGKGMKLVVEVTALTSFQGGGSKHQSYALAPIVLNVQVGSDSDATGTSVFSYAAGFFCEAGTVLPNVPAVVMHSPEAGQVVPVTISFRLRGRCTGRETFFLAGVQMRASWHLCSDQVFP
eukprot:TRINITY_DN65975_c0_g1_i1.p1 TRINITY_DN65975_c0_g1~~TRINITY_DN65975_c0_g1_i1.p1  ORF type:complete len:376 (+),score=70.38 TRINITY_DN65975_c0_g1_i1:54-1181(+)